MLERDAYVEYASGKMAICQMKLHKQCSAVNAKVWIAFVLSDSVFYKLLGGEGFECTHRAKVVFYLFHLFNLIEIIKFKPFKTVCLLRHFESLLQKLLTAYLYGLLQIALIYALSLVCNIFPPK